MAALTNPPLPCPEARDALRRGGTGFHHPHHAPLLQYLHTSRALNTDPCTHHSPFLEDDTVQLALALSPFLPPFLDLRIGGEGEVGGPVGGRGGGEERGREGGCFVGFFLE
jgi:hypothetical protein